MSVAIIAGDCREVLAGMAEASIDACVTDPPYHLTTGKKGGTGEASLNLKSPAGRSRISTGGFMGQSWDGGDVAFRPETWAEVLRVLKPGGHIFAFGGTRTYHRLACAIEDAGFEIRDQFGWAFGSGFPKSRNLDGDWQGWGTAIKPAWEPIVLARKPLERGLTVAANVLKWGTGALNIDGCRMNRGSGEFVQPPGRWPANLVHDGSDEVLACFPDAGGGDKRGALAGRRPGGFGDVGAPKGNDGPCAPVYADSGSAARFFYCAKASRSERGEGNNHPTVKPVALMRWLIRLITPPGGVVLDPFAGSGTAGLAADRLQLNAILIELDPAYAEIARRRLEADSGMFALIDHPLTAASG